MVDELTRKKGEISYEYRKRSLIAKRVKYVKERHNRDYLFDGRKGRGGHAFWGAVYNKGW